MDSLLSNGVWIALIAAASAAVVFFIRAFNVFRYIPNNQVGIVEKLWAPRGSIKSGFIALHGEAGFRPKARGNGPG